MTTADGPVRFAINIPKSRFITRYLIRFNIDAAKESALSSSFKCYHKPGQ